MITSFTKIENILNARIRNPIYNTSYPLEPKDWKPYETEGNLPFNPNKPIAFYFHIPFCRQLCLFCEYSRIIIPKESIQLQYISTLLKDSNKFKEIYASLQLYGFDIGGGTPTALDLSAFDELLTLFSFIVNNSSLTDDFEPSIEATFQTINQEKISLIAKNGFRRISLGIQSSSSSLMHSYNRASQSLEKMKETIELIHLHGIPKINIDIMYGITVKSF